MDYSAMLSDSFEYAKEALIGKWGRWILFILFGLPFALIPVTFDPENLVDKATGAFHPELVHWDQLAVLIGAGILLGFFISGYIVRVYRGARPAPSFDHWAGLFTDGLKLQIVWFLWLLPFLLAMTATVALIIVTILSVKEQSGALIASLGLLLVLLLACVVLAIVAALYGYLGSVRYARTGSIREGMRFRAITAMIRRMGWLSYIIALVVMLIAGFAFSIVTMILAIIPYIGQVFILIITPFATIFFGRYVMLVFEQGEDQPVAGSAEITKNPG